MAGMLDPKNVLDPKKLTKKINDAELTAINPKLKEELPVTAPVIKGAPVPKPSIFKRIKALVTGENPYIDNEPK